MSDDVLSPPSPAASSCAEVQAMLAAHALGALEPWEQRAVETHIAACPACRTALSRHQRTAVALDLGLAPIAPPAALRRRLLAEIVRSGAAADLPFAPTAAFTPGRNAHGDRRWRRAAIGLSAVAAALLVALVIVGMLLRQAEGARDDALTDRRVFAEYLGNGGVVTALVPAPGASAAAGQGSLIVAPNQPRAALIVAGLAMGDGQRCRVWVERDGERTWLSELELDAGGTGYLMLTAPAPLSTYDIVGIALETPGRADQDLLTARIRTAT